MSDYEELQAHLRDDGLEDLAEFVDGPVGLNELSIGDFLDALRENWIIRLRNDDEEIQYAQGGTGEWIQIRDGDRDGEFARPFEAWAGEIEAICSRGATRWRSIYPGGFGPSRWQRHE